MREQLARTLGRILAATALSGAAVLATVSPGHAASTTTTHPAAAQAKYISASGYTSAQVHGTWAGQPPVSQVTRLPDKQAKTRIIELEVSGQHAEQDGLPRHLGLQAGLQRLISAQRAQDERLGGHRVDVVVRPAGPHAAHVPDDVRAGPSRGEVAADGNHERRVDQLAEPVQVP